MIKIEEARFIWFGQLQGLAEDTDSMVEIQAMREQIFAQIMGWA